MAGNRQDLEHDPVLQEARTNARRAELIAGYRRTARTVTHQDPPPDVVALREELSTDPVRWLKFHAPEACNLPFSEDHITFINDLYQAMRFGGKKAIGMPRGAGKTTIVKYLSLMGILEGYRRFIAVIAATAPLAKSYRDFYINRLEVSPTLHAHYPHITTYFKAAEGRHQKASNQLQADGTSTAIGWTPNRVELPLIKVLGQPDTIYPGSGAMIGTTGIEGAVRGLNKDLPNGEVIRPDFVIIDDPQDRNSAMSPQQCTKRELIIQGDVMGLAGPTTRLSAVMPCTIIRKGDLAARYLDRKIHPEWSGSTYRMVEKWPKALNTLWKEYEVIYKDCLAGGEGIKAANDFYKKHRKVMDEGGVVSWEHRVREGEVSAIQSAMHLLIEHGDQFYAEYQNEPIEGISSLYTLTPELVRSRTIDVQPGEIPDWVTTVLASSDVNPTYGITTALLGFDGEQRCHVIWYGVTPCAAPVKLSEMQRKRIIVGALAATMKQLQAMPVPPERWYIDGGGSPQDTIVDFAAVATRRYGLSTMTCFGRGWRNYKVYAKAGQRLRTGYNFTNVTRSLSKYWTLWQADYWREVAQKAWTTTPSAPGAATLPQGNHREFAEQICAEQLVGKKEVEGYTVWVWDTAGGKHDFGDVMAQGFMGACELQGIGGEASQTANQARRQKGAMRGATKDAVARAARRTRTTRRRTTTQVI